MNGIGRNGNFLILPTPIPSSLQLRFRLRFSPSRKRSYESDYDSVASKKPAFRVRKVYNTGIQNQRHFLILEICGRNCGIMTKMSRFNVSESLQK